MQNNKSNGDLLINKLKSVQQKYPAKIKEVRGMGLMLGVELTSPGQNVVDELMKRNVLVNCTNENVIRLLPPYIITNEEIDLFCSKFEEVISIL
jgi:acetylornithine/N-succinyldiaminopimelate aminotransferase